MSRKGFWYGLVAGMVIMGLVAASIGVVFMAFRWAQGGTTCLHGREFGFGFRQGMKGFGFRGRAPTFGRHVKPFALGALLCLHVPLLALGGLFVAAMIGRRACWYRRHLHHGHWGRHEACWPEAEPATHDAGPEPDSAAD